MVSTTYWVCHPHIISLISNILPFLLIMTFFVFFPSFDQIPSYFQTTALITLSLWDYLLLNVEFYYFISFYNFILLHSYFFQSTSTTPIAIWNNSTFHYMNLLTFKYFSYKTGDFTWFRLGALTWVCGCVSMCMSSLPLYPTM